MVIHETEHFVAGVPESPHVDRDDGGHVIIWPKMKVRDRTKLSPEQAIELMKLTMMVGEAMETALNERGIDVVRINYQDNGNWGFLSPSGPFLHVHLYGRAKSSKMQKHGEALHLPMQDGFYDNCRPLSEDDVAAIRDVMNRVMAQKKYRNFCCGHR